MLLTRWLNAAFVLLLLACWPAGAEPALTPGDETKAIKLDYKDRPGGAGRLAATEITLSAEPQRFYVRGTDVSAPFSVQVIAASKDRPLDVTLHRQHWGKAVQSGSTGKDGSFVFEGRAYGDVGVQLTSPDGAPARATVVFWQGTPAAPSMAKVYTNPEQMKAANAGSAGGTGGTSFIMYVIAGLLAVIVVFLGIMLVRRGKGGSAAMLLIGGMTLAAIQMPPPSFAQGEDAPNPFDIGSEQKPAPSSGTPRELKPGEVPNPFDVDGPVPEIQGDKDKDASAGKPEDKPKDSFENPFTGETTTGSGRPIELKPEDFDPSNAPKEDAPVDDGYKDRLDQAEQRIQDLHREASANRAEIERLRMLVESDRKNEPDPSNLPPMPLSCRPPSIERGTSDNAAEAAWKNFDDCQACYREPLAQLDELLLNYERLRILYMSTSDFVDTAITMGDTVPKPHQFVEMAWAKEKAGIQKSFQQTKEAYDNKWAEFNDRLIGLLDEVGTCEANLNNNPMWRETEGRLFYNTIKASYQRTN